MTEAMAPSSIATPAQNPALAANIPGRKAATSRLAAIMSRSPAPKTDREEKSGNRGSTTGAATVDATSNEPR